MAVAAPSANAGVLVASADNCPDQTVDKVFRPWLDPMNYTLMPGGTLEDGAAGWSLNGASVVSGNEPWEVHGDGDSRSLKIPAGKSATTDSICVGLEHPTLRFFAKSSGDSLLGSLVATLTVEVLFEDNYGGVHALPSCPTRAGARRCPTRSWSTCSRCCRAIRPLCSSASARWAGPAGRSTTSTSIRTAAADRKTALR
jgi:hypothetical protein